MTPLRRREEVEMTDERLSNDAFDDPAQFFDSPRAVIEAAGFSKADKIAILERWRLDALRLADSEQEGMGGGENAQLADIEQLLLELRGE
jgi:hypothetical protein